MVALIAAGRRDCADFVLRRKRSPYGLRDNLSVLDRTLSVMNCWKTLVRCDA